MFDVRVLSEGDVVVGAGGVVDVVGCDVGDVVVVGDECVMVVLLVLWLGPVLVS